MTMANVCRNAKVMIMTTCFNASWILMTITELDRSSRVSLLTYLPYFVSGDGVNATI